MRHSKEAYACGVANLADALGNWNASRKGERAGPIVRFPRFKSKRRSTCSYTITTGAFGLATQDRRHVKLPRIGLVRTHDSTRKLARRVEADTARILKATVSYRRGRCGNPDKTSHAGMECRHGKTTPTGAAKAA